MNNKGILGRMAMSKGREILSTIGFLAVLGFLMLIAGNIAVLIYHTIYQVFISVPVETYATILSIVLAGITGIIIFIVEIIVVAVILEKI